VGVEPNHYAGAIPVEDVRRRLFGWEPIEAMSAAVIMTDDGVQTIVDESRKQIVHPDTGAVLGVFKSGYQVHGYDEWLVQNVESILDDDDLQIGSAGLLRGGAQGWVQIEIDATQMVEGVEHRPFLTAAGDVREALQLVLSAGDAFNAQVRELIAEPVSEQRFERFPHRADRHHERQQARGHAGGDQARRAARPVAHR
jgi:hypothetical protein